MKQRFRELIKTNRWLKFVPNFLTICNSLCGFAAILYTLRAYEKFYNSNDVFSVFAISALLICCAMIFDVFDGFAARLFNAASMHGIQMDSLADMVTFGVAPATLVAIMTHSLRNWELNRSSEIILYILCSVYLGCAALRLATYNVHAIQKKKSGDKFSGLPSPGAAAAICVVVLYASTARIDLNSLALILPCYAAVLGGLMVSTIPYTHAGKWMLSVRRNRKRALLLVVILVSILLFRIPALAVIITIYILSGPVGLIWHKLHGSVETPAEIESRN